MGALVTTLTPRGNPVYLTELVTPHTYLVDRAAPQMAGLTVEDTVYNCMDYVCRNIRYQREPGDTFHSPSEALHMGHSDCEEHSFVLCSLLRHHLSPDEVWVAFGYHGSSGHAWVTWLKGKYWVLESTLGQAPTELPEQGYPYEPYLLFNDVNFVELRPGYFVGQRPSREVR